MKRENRGRVSSGAAWRALLVALACVCAASCKEPGEELTAAPRTMRDVPAARLAFRFEPDAKDEALPERLKAADAEEPLAAIKADFEGRRGNAEALIRTVLDPTGQRALAVYGTSETQTDFRLDLYSADGQFIRNVLPKDLTGVFPSEVAWSPDGQSIAFVGIRNPSLAAPTPPADTPDPVTGPGLPTDPNATPTPAAPLIPSVPTYATEQVYVGDRDGFNLRPLTSREGLIYFRLAWAPDGRALAALACKEDEWAARKTEGRLPAGRPRLVTLEGQERLLDDRLTEVAPAWSPDASKIATAFEYDVAVYDAEGAAPTGAALPLRDPLRASSVEFDARIFRKADANGASGANAAPPAPTPAPSPAAEQVLNSFNPFVRVEWVEPETLYAQTAFVRFYKEEPVTTYARWHVVKIYPQVAVVK